MAIMSADPVRPHALTQPGKHGRSRPRLLVIQPDPLGALDRFAEWLTNAGLEVRVIRPFAGEEIPNTLAEDGLLVLGGDMGANDDDEYPWLADIRHLLRHTVDSALPTLGICLGGQLLAKALGGTVTVGDRELEAGVVSISWRPAAHTDTLFADLPTPFLVGAMHDDVVSELPGEAVWLGQGDMYPHQAFRAGACAWGVQFHPEVSCDGYRKWVAAWDGTSAVAWNRLQQGVADFHRFDDEIAGTTRILAHRFADVIHAQSRTPLFEPLPEPPG